MQSILEEEHEHKVFQLASNHPDVEQFLQGEVQNDVLGVQKNPPLAFDQRIESWVPEDAELLVQSC